MSEDTELDGMAAVAQGVAEQRWPHTMDAQVWAKEFMEHQAKYGPYDEAGMLGWFANAIMAGYDTAMSRKESSVPRAWWKRLRAWLAENNWDFEILDKMQEIEKEAEG